MPLPVARCCGGYGTQKELAAAGAYDCAAFPNDLPAMIMKQPNS